MKPAHINHKNFNNYSNIQYKKITSEYYINMYEKHLRVLGYHVYRDGYFLKTWIDGTFWSILFNNNDFNNIDFIDNIWEIAVMVNRNFYIVGHGKTIDKLISFFKNPYIYIAYNSNLNPNAKEFYPLK